MGVLVAWVLVRYQFPGRRLVDALVDLPFALPTAVAGIALTATWAPNGLLGKHLHALGIPGAYSRFGVVIALTFIGLPFVVRTVQPVLAALDPRVEEAAATLGATRAQTFRRVILPALRPAIVTGFALAFARALGEYGSVVFIVREHADEDRDRAAARDEQARAVRLRRRHRDRARHARRVVLDPGRDQRPHLARRPPRPPRPVAVPAAPASSAAEDPR